MKAPLSQASAAQMREEGRDFVDLLRSPEAGQAFAAFFEKRQQDYSRFS